MIALSDRMEIEDGSVRKTRDGYLVANARTARTGIQTYSARELGLTDRDPSAKVRVYRSPDEVFSADAMGSMGFRPMTNDHPDEAVTADNWKRFSVGNAGGDVVRDGEFVRVPLVMMDASAIADYQAGKRELSWGYTCELKMTDGVTPGGEAYDAIQTDIRANHIALCEKARGGDKLTFGDHQETTPVKTIIVDGLSVEVTDAAELAIRKLERTVADGLALITAAQTKAGELAGTLAVRDGELAAAKQAIEDAKVTPEKMAAMVADRAALETSAKPFLGDSYDFKGKTDDAIRRAAVASKVGDKAVAMSDAEISGAFSFMAGSVSTPTHDGVAVAVQSGGLSAVDAEKVADKARLDMIAELRGEKKAA